MASHYSASICAKLVKPKLVKTLQTGLKKWRSVLSNFPGAGCWTITAHDTGRWIHQGDTKRKRLNGMQCLTCPIAGPFFGEMIEVIVLNIWEVRTESVGHAWAWPLEQHLFTFFFEQYRVGGEIPTYISHLFTFIFKLGDIAPSFRFLFIHASMQPISHSELRNMLDIQVNFWRIDSVRRSWYAPPTWITECARMIPLLF